MAIRAMEKKKLITWCTAWLMFGIVLLYYAPACSQDPMPTSPPVPVGSGARAQGMGGAFIAVADDATAASWNPGGLGQLQKPEMSLVLSGFSRNEDYDSSQKDDTRSSTSSSDLNYLSYAYARNIWRRNFFISLNYQKLFDFSRKVKFTETYPSDELISAYTVKYDFQQDGSLYAFSPALSVEVVPGFYAGLAYNTWSEQITGRGHWEGRKRYTSEMDMLGTHYTLIGDFKTRYKVSQGENLTLGFLWKITQQLQVGGVYKTPFRAKVKAVCQGFVMDTMDPDPNGTIP
ncbi:MAG: hypothetical protein AB1847_11150, partial [bacterium]